MSQLSLFGFPHWHKSTVIKLKVLPESPETQVRISSVLFCLKKRKHSLLILDFESAWNSVGESLFGFI